MLDSFNVKLVLWVMISSLCVMFMLFKLLCGLGFVKLLFLVVCVVCDRFMFFLSLLNI